MRPLARPSYFIVEEIAGDVVVYDRKSKKAHSLNPSVAWIWRQCDGTTDIDQLSLRFERHFNCSDGRDLVLAGLEKLQTAGLLESIDDAPSSNDFGPMISRRSALTSGSALVPLLATVLVPAAAAAKSGDTGEKVKKVKDKG